MSNDPRFDPYRILNVTSTATDEEIKRAWRVMSAKAHPDREGGSTGWQTDVNMAYKILSDAEMRAQFDKTGETAQAYAPGHQLENKARDLILRMVQIVIRDQNASPYDDLIAILRQGLEKQLEGCRKSRQTTHQQLSVLRLRLSQLKGPPDNFIQLCLEQEIARGEEHLPTYDADEKVIGFALDLLKKFSYGHSSTLVMAHSFFGSVGFLDNPGKA